MVKSKKSKCVKSSNRSNNSISMDRFSNLPDHLISHILSFLPTEEAVATSILSTRWKFLWTFITNLDFSFNCDFLCESHNEMRKQLRIERIAREKFARFVNRVLLRLNPPSIQKFSLGVCCPDCVDPSYLSSWISAGFRLAVHKVSLYLFWDCGYQYTLSQIDTNVAVLKLYGSGIHFNIPAEASLCFPSLQALHLTDIPCEIASNSSVSFPNLKIMRLTHVMFENEDSAHKLLSSSPVLDDLFIKDASFPATVCLIIQIPSLTKLSIEDSGYYEVNKLQIECRALQYLQVCDDYPCEYLLVDNLPCLVRANIKIFFSNSNVDVEGYNSIINFVQSLSNVKFLSVSDGVIKALKTASTNFKSGFPNLTRLGISFFNCVDLCVMISNFLESMDNLEHIIMKGCHELRPNCSHPSWWTERVNVPKCLLSRVANISFSYMNVDCCDQLELLRYFLENAQVLQSLTISINHISEREQLELVKKISLMPRGSRRCQVSFT